MFRKTIFWTHLVSGVLTGIVIFTMSITGVLLTYQRQINEWVAESHYVPEAEQGTRLPVEQLLLIQQTRQPDFSAATVVVSNDPGAPVSFREGRRSGLSLNPYSGEPMETSSPALSSFFSSMTGFHRWFNIEGENRDLARDITGVSNVVFLFLVISGMYLWLPKVWRGAMFRARLLFRSSYPDSKARDFHWHHIFGIWAAIPLLAVVYTGAVISYPWAANLMYAAFGAEVAAPGGPAPAAPQAQAATGRQATGQPAQVQGAQAGQQAQDQGGQQAQQQARQLAAANSSGADQGSIPRISFMPLDALVARAAAESSNDWNRMNISVPRADAATVQIEVDQGNGAQAHKRHTLSLDRSSGSVVEVRTFADQPETQRLRGIARFLHTGEVLGFWGQTLAGLASFAALFMVWTGFALSWRRLIQPLFRR